MITYVSPLTYANDLIQSGYYGKTVLNPFVDLAMLVVFILIFQVVANWLYKRFNDWTRRAEKQRADGTEGAVGCAERFGCTKRKHR